LLHGNETTYFRTTIKVNHMPKFRVDITRIGYAHTTIDIEADDIFEAREQAKETAGNYSYSEKSADYEVGTATEIKNNQIAEVAKQINTKFGEMLKAMGEAGEAAKWEEDISDFDPENKESVEKCITYYAGLIKNVNEKFSAFLSKKAEVFGE
jgi:hypothetical protein